MPGCGWSDFQGAARSRQCGEHLEDKKSDCALHADNERKRVFPLLTRLGSEADSPNNENRRGAFRSESLTTSF